MHCATSTKEVHEAQAQRTCIACRCIESHDKMSDTPSAKTNIVQKKETTPKRCLMLLCFLPLSAHGATNQWSEHGEYVYGCVCMRVYLLLLALRPINCSKLYSSQNVVVKSNQTQTKANVKRVHQPNDRWIFWRQNCERSSCASLECNGNRGDDDVNDECTEMT